MKTDENLLEEMLERSTNPSQVEVDNMAVQIFCMLVNNNKDALVEKAQQLIVDKIKSHNTTEADKAIGLLEECMSKGGEDFQRKTAKFVFLNKLIGLVLDKPTGPPGSLPDPPVPLQTKKRIMECLMLWTVEHADKNKILEAYDNLKKQINFPHGPAASVNNAKSSTNGGAGVQMRDQRASILGKDDLLVAKLLKEGGEENYRKANLVIQHRFNQEARRIEFICHLKSELKKIENTMELLEQMINVYSTEPSSTDDKEIMQSLYSTCEGHNEQMARWPDFLGDSEPDFLSDVLITKDHLFSLLQRYNELINGSDENKYQTKTTTTTTTQVIAGSNATPLINTSRSFASASASAKSTTSNADILSELLGDTTLNPPTATPSANNKVDNAKSKADNKNSTLDELTEIFGSIETKNNESTNYPTDLLNNLDLLEPISVFKTKAKMEAENENSTTTTDGGGVETQKQHGFKELREIDKISEELFKKSLQNEQRQATFKKEPEKVTLNDLAKDKMQISLKSQQQQNGNTTTMDCKSNDEPMLMSDITNTDEKKNSLEIENEKPITDCVSIESKEENKTIENNAIKPQPLSSPATVATSSKPLAEIQIDLDQLTPIAEGQRILMDDEDIEVSLNFTSDRPSPHVSVIVMSVVNKSRLPVEDFQFEASVKKPCKVRLLPPTDTRLAPRKPFRPSEPINQVILLMNPTEKAVDVTCIVGYRLGDDPDPIKESIIAKNIPYV